MTTKKAKTLTIIDGFVIIFFNLFLLLVSILLPAVCIASSEGFYKTQLEKTGIYGTIDEDGNKQPASIYYIGGNRYMVAQFTDEQLDTIVEHIIDYLFTDKESFALQMDGVYLNGQIEDEVDIFSDVSVSHMEDVKELFSLVVVLTIVFAVITVGLGVYMILRRKQISQKVLRYTLFFYLGFLALAGFFLGWTAGAAAKHDVPFTSQLWNHCHYLFFPFSGDKFSGSFFNDTLTYILSLDFFMSAVTTVLIITGVVLVIWFTCAVLLKRLCNPFVIRANEEQKDTKNE